MCVSDRIVCGQYECWIRRDGMRRRRRTDDGGGGGDNNNNSNKGNQPQQIIDKHIERARDCYSVHHSIKLRTQMHRTNLYVYEMDSDWYTYSDVYRMAHDIQWTYTFHAISIGRERTTHRHRVESNRVEFSRINIYVCVCIYVSVSPSPRVHVYGSLFVCVSECMHKAYTLLCGRFYVVFFHHFFCIPGLYFKYASICERICSMDWCMRERIK